MFPPFGKENLCLFIIFSSFYICAVLLVLAFSVVWAFANTDPIFTALKVFTFGAGGVGRALCFAPVVLASVLHHRHERRSIIRVNRLFYKVGIDHDRFAQGTLSVTFLIVTVSQLKGLTVGGYDLVEITLLVWRVRNRKIISD